MQEIVLFLSSIAGAATAVAYKKFPKNKAELENIGASPHIKNQINSLKLEKDILTKTITRLYQSDAGLSKIQRDKLLLRYQHQLGVILAKIEKLEAAAKHPDLGPIGDGLITLMDQKLSQLDQRLYEISSKITVANVQVPELKKEKPKKSFVKEEKIEFEKKEIKKEVEKSIEKLEPKLPFQNIEIDEKPKHPIEIVTLTNLPKNSLEFPLIERRPIEPKTEIINEISKSLEPEPKMQIIQASLGSSELKLPEIESTKPQIQEPLPKPEPVKEIENKSKPTVNLPEESDEDDNDDDLDKIKGEIMKTLSKLQEAEVE